MNSKSVSVDFDVYKMRMKELIGEGGKLPLSRYPKALHSLVYGHDLSDLLTVWRASNAMSLFYILTQPYGFLRT